MGLKDIGLRSSYVGKGSKLLKEFLLPVLDNAVFYDRIAGYYTLESLLSISQGLDKIYKKKGKMRLIIGIHSFPPELVDATLRQEYLKEQIATIRKEITEGITSLTDGLKKDCLATLAWMIEDDLLEVKAAAVVGNGIFHSKAFYLRDENNDRIVAVGSSNETYGGLGSNFENILVIKSWVSSEDVAEEELFFETLWNNEHEDAIVSDVSEETAVTILSSLGKQYQRAGHNKPLPQKGKGLIDISSKMLTNFFVSGDIPALYVHQEKAVIEALSRWPVRVLFSDEVGLGKTFEVAATMTFMIKYCGVKRVIILTPKSVLRQWWDELYDHFHISAWMYESNTRAYQNKDGSSITMKKGSPIGKDAPDLILMSVQYARGSGENGDIFSYPDSVLPELLIVDEAHSARVSKSFSGTKKKTRVYRMLESITRKIPHMILATATPMQKEADEYHAVLKLLGLPKVWQKTRNYETSLKLIASQDVPDTSDAYSAAILLLKTLSDMSPDISMLEKSEKQIVREISSLYGNTDEYGLGTYVQKNWTVFRTVFIKLHPAHLLTVRNTRRSLAQVGYRFPKRNLNVVSINDSMQVQMYYQKVDQYLISDCFSIERVLYPERKVSLGFVQVSYRQRVASSLYSCKESLGRRYEKVKALKKVIEGGATDRASLEQDFDLSRYWDEFDSDQLLGQDIDDTADAISGSIDMNELKWAVGVESMALSSLIKEAGKLLDCRGDLKIIRSIDVALDRLSQGDQVLLFSRYTDTVDALIEEFKQRDASVDHAFGIYTGECSMIIDKDYSYECNKEELKKALFSKSVRVVFCSDAASEGLNLQAARVLINVDVPWTPARLEQRIGRIARLGQIANVVDIYNVWYPYSIEARMYKRIQKRLEETNLAIGEFPDIVATNIRAAVLEGVETDATGMDELKEIRNSYQTKALEALWTGSGKNTESEAIRKDLVAICDKNFPMVNELLDGTIRAYQMPDGSVVELTWKDGMKESISLRSVPWQYIDFADGRIGVVFDTAGRPAAFSLDLPGGNRLISHESVLRTILNQDVAKAHLLDGRPKMLADSGKLDLRYTVDAELHSAPEYWIESQVDKK